MFTKGQQVTFISNWDGKGTICIRNLIVYSCGKKQMVLTYENGDKFMESLFLPAEEQYGFGRVVARLDNKAAEELGLKIAETVLAYKKESIERSLEQTAPVAYLNARKKDLAELHEPRIIWK